MSKTKNPEYPLADTVKTFEVTCPKCKSKRSKDFTIDMIHTVKSMKCEDCLKMFYVETLVVVSTF